MALFGIVCLTGGGGGVGTVNVRAVRGGGGGGGVTRIGGASAHQLEADALDETAGSL
jgi:hypothetical protein